MRASSLNFRDLVVPERGYGSYTGELPLIPISDGVGVVSAVGSGVTRVKVGDRVCPTYFQNWQGGEPDLQRLTQSLGGPIDGTMTETMCLSEQGVVVDFFGKPCRFPQGPARLSLATGAPIIPAFCLRRTNDSFTTVFLPPVPAPEEGTREEKVVAMTQSFAHIIEDAIRMNPEQWAVFYPIWEGTWRPE